MNAIKPGDLLEFGVSEPADFFEYAGDGPYTGVVLAADATQIEIGFTPHLQYAGHSIERGTAKPRHQDGFSAWDGYSVKIVNVIVEVPGLTHLIGGVRLRR